MVDRPILFSAPMILALLAGRKTQTRRILKPQPYYNGMHFDGREIICHCDYLPPSTLMREVGGPRHGYTATDAEDGVEALAGFHVGERLYVREAVKRTHPDSNRFSAVYVADGAEYPLALHKNSIPGIHMPRNASRLTLTVTDVRVEKLQKITPADAIAEGIAPRANSQTIDCDTPDPRINFKALWNSINGPDAWDANPWVVALTFAVARRNIDQMESAA